MSHTGSGAGRVDRVAAWRSPLAVAVGGVLLFETLTGLSIYLLPFSIPNQVMVAVHTVLGVLFILPFAWYQLMHWRTYRHYALSHTTLTGYAGLIATAVCLVSGVVLTAQALFGRRIDYAWDMAHIVSTIVVLALVVPHIGWLVWRDARAARRDAEAGLGMRQPVRAAERRYGAWALLTALLCFGVVGAARLAYRAPKLVDAFPSDYQYVYGPEKPFAPSLARTVTNEAYDARRLSGSQSCGTSGCHEQIAKEWQVSAHRWAAMDPGFMKIQAVMATQNGTESTRYCAGCHDPISLFEGTKNIFTDQLTGKHGFDEGVSCLSCHSIRETDVKGNANYIVEQPPRYMFEMSAPDDAAARFARDFLIRAYPRAHVNALAKRTFKTPEYCAACHKQFIDQQVNQVGWVQLQNQYDNWRKSHWNHPGDPQKTIECRECHMPLIESTDPAAGDGLDYNRTATDGMHRSHRFLGANQMMPTMLKLAGGQEQVDLVSRWLSGKIEVPEIAHKWEKGPVVAVAIEAPETAVAGQPLSIKAVTTSRKVGHDFPTGPLDIIQSWVEVVVKDDAGKVVFQSGGVDDEHFIQKGSFIFKAEGVDQYGNLIDRHNLWEMAGVRFRRSLFPGFSDSSEYTFGCPSSVSVMAETPGAGDHTFQAPAPAAGTKALHITARLRYRKYDQFLLNYMFGVDSGITAPITDIATAEATVRVVEHSASAR